jgi:hypothetical protein
MKTLFVHGFGFADAGIASAAAGVDGGGAASGCSIGGAARAAGAGKTTAIFGLCASRRGFT